MILVRAPLRISFVGGGTDLPMFYKQYPGRVISSSIDKFVYITINKTQYYGNKFILKYSQTEVVDRPEELKHTRFRAALQEAGITKGGLEISSLADLPSGSGLGSSSSFSCAVIKGLGALQGKRFSAEELARKACHLEIDVLGDGIGRQDQYASAYGGFNILQFNSDDTVEVSPIMLNHTDIDDFKKHLLLFYTGMTRQATSVLIDQQQNMNDNLDTYKKMSDSVFEFKDKLINKDFPGLGAMLMEGWERKKSLSGKISGEEIDNLYEIAIKNGAWGGKVLGAGGGGTMLFIAPPEKHSLIREALKEEALKNNLACFEEIDFAFTQSGADVLFNNN